MQILFHLHVNKTNLHMKGFALGRCLSSVSQNFKRIWKTTPLTPFFLWNSYHSRLSINSKTRNSENCSRKCHHVDERSAARDAVHQTTAKYQFIWVHRNGCWCKSKKSERDLRSCEVAWSNLGVSSYLFRVLGRSFRHTFLLFIKWCSLLPYKVNFPTH